MTQNGITRRQHYVPDFYLQGWATDDGKVTAHDLQSLKDKKTFRTDPANVLVQSYFYEEDTANPDNRIENILSAMEGRTASVVKKVRAVTAATDVKAAAATLSRSLTGAGVDVLAEFAAYQYMRVPGAIEQKRYELQTSALDETTKTHHLNPGRFVEGGYAYVVDHFKAMKYLFFISSGQDFVTSDWPCFDMDEDNRGTLLGEEVGRKTDVVAYMPLTPRVGMVMYPVGINQASLNSRRWGASVQPDSFVRNQNTLIIQKAERYVVARKESPFIFAVAVKRRKSQPQSL
ncbi:hypothetical protein ABIA06_002067 [Bradyrhizobium yuanmingense]|uniref:DUF4238 domain-containing protein n=1 Tax=Bradyrhizobium yuanmingense TaxID=108015 RepID=UPI0035198488